MGVATNIATPPGARLLRPIRVMIVDDSLTVRAVLSRTIESAADLEVVSRVSSAELGLRELDQTKPDVVLLDLEMPGMGGFRALPKFLAASPAVKVLVVSSLTEDGAEATVAALSMGAAETMPKPQSGQFAEDFRVQLVEKIRALGGGQISRATGQTPVVAAPRISRPARRPRVIAIGASTGGIHALNQLLRAYPASIDVPILVTQHLPGSFIPVFAKQVESASGRKAIVVDNETPIKPGMIHIAPGNGHMTLREFAGELRVRIIEGAMPSGCTPSVDPMFESLATAVGGDALGVVLSGMGKDGAIGARALVDAGGTIFAQDQESSAVWGMPRAVAERGLASAILSPGKLAVRMAALLEAGAWK